MDLAKLKDDIQKKNLVSLVEHEPLMERCNSWCGTSPAAAAGGGFRGACNSSLPEEEEVLGRGLFLACESNSQKRSDENQDG